MNFVARIEERLRDLSAEARHRHPGVKEASERAVLALRAAKARYATEVRSAVGDGDGSSSGGASSGAAASSSRRHPTTAVFRSQDVLRPFLLACHYPDADAALIDAALGAVRDLIAGDAVAPEDAVHVARVLCVQAAVVRRGDDHRSSSSGWARDAAARLRERPRSASENAVVGESVLRTVESLAASPTLGGPDEEVLGQVAAACVALASGTSGARRAAASTLRGALGTTADRARDDVAARRAAAAAARDLSALTDGRPARGPFRAAGRGAGASSPPPPAACLSLLRAILERTPRESWSTETEEDDERSSLPRLLREEVCPLAASMLLKECSHEDSDQGSSNEDFATLVGSVGLASTIVRRFGRERRDECRVLIASLVRFVSCAAEAYRESEHFEDNYVYDERRKRRRRRRRRRRPDEPERRGAAVVSDDVSWRCALALEALWELTINKDDDTAAALLGASSEDDVADDDDEGRRAAPRPALLASYAEAASSLAVAVLSRRDGVVGVADAVRGRRRDDPPRSFARARSFVGDPDDWARVGSVPTPTADEGETGRTAVLCVAACLSAVGASAAIVARDGVGPAAALARRVAGRAPASTALSSIVAEALRAAADAASRAGDAARVRVACRVASRGDARAHRALWELVHARGDDPSTDWRAARVALETAAGKPVDVTKTSQATASRAIDRLPTFSTSLSAAALRRFATALAEPDTSTETTKEGTEATSATDSDVTSEVSSFADDDATQPPPRSSTHPPPPPATPTSLGGKLLSFAGRAFSGGGPPPPPSHHHPHHSTTTTAGDEYSDDDDDDSDEDENEEDDSDDDALVDEGEDDPTLEPPSSRYGGALYSSAGLLLNERTASSAAVVLLGEIARANAFRFAACGPIATERLRRAAAEDETLRPYAAETLASLISARLEAEDDPEASTKRTLRAVRNPSGPRDWLATEPRGEDDDDDEEELPSLSQREALAPLARLASDASSRDAAVAGLGALRAVLERDGHRIDDDAWTALLEDAVGASPGDPAAFDVLRLVVDDFAATLSASDAARRALLTTCSSFVARSTDVNASLAAVGMLWTAADAGGGDAEDALTALAAAAADPRAEVRDCAVNTLFSCAIGTGERWTPDDWERCLGGVVLGVVDDVAATARRGGTTGATEETTDVPPARWRARVHHSRDSRDKRWYGTRALTHRGLERALRQYFWTLSRQPWFVGRGWDRVLDGASDAATDGPADARAAAADALVLCARCASRAGAATAPARVGTDMRVVDGALRRAPSRRASDRAADDAAPPPTEEELSVRADLFRRAFDAVERCGVALCGEAEDDAAAVADDDDDLRRRRPEPASTRVLFDLATGLARLRDSCGSHETAPRPNPSWDDDDDDRPDTTTYEDRLARLAARIAASATNPRARFPTQPQRVCVDLLSSMCDDGSDRAFRTLADMGRRCLVERTSDDDDDGTTYYEGARVLEHEAAKTVSAAFSKSGPSAVAKAAVLSDLLRSFEETRNDADAPVEGSYRLLAPAVRFGLRAAASLEEKDDDGEVARRSDPLWTRAVDFLATSLRDAVAADDPDAAAERRGLAAEAAASVPPRRDAAVAAALADAADAALAAEDDATLRVCLLAARDRGSSLPAAVGRALREGVERPDERVAAALVACEAASDPAAVFPWLCRAAASDDARLRRAAAARLAEVDVEEVRREARDQRTAREAADRAAETWRTRAAELGRENATLRRRLAEALGEPREDDDDDDDDDDSYEDETTSDDADVAQTSLDVFSDMYR